MRGFGVRVRAYVHACVRWMHFAVAGGFACMHACAGCIVHEGRANARHPCSARAHTAHGAMRALPRPRTCPTEARCPRHALIARAWPGAGAAHAAKTSGGGGAGGTAAAAGRGGAAGGLGARPQSTAGASSGMPPASSAATGSAVRDAVSVFRRRADARVRARTRTHGAHARAHTLFGCSTSRARITPVRAHAQKKETALATATSRLDKGLVRYRKRYPGEHLNDTRLRANVEFYQNQKPSRPDGDFIDSLHTKWAGDYRKLEVHHGYIQWLFPIHESGMNSCAQVLQRHEAATISADARMQQRVHRSYALMLDFYGARMVSKETGELARSQGYQGRLANLNAKSHNYLRITRILKSLGEFGLERWKLGLIVFLANECLYCGTIPKAAASLRDYWIATLRDDAEYMMALAVVRKELPIAKALLYVQDRTSAVLCSPTPSPAPPKPAAPTPAAGATPTGERPAKERAAAAGAAADTASRSQPNAPAGAASSGAAGGAGGGGGAGRGGGGGDEAQDDEDLDDLDWDAAEQMALNSPPASAPTDPPRPAVPPAAAPTAPAPAPCAAAAAEDDDDDAPLLALPAASGVAACTTSPAAQGSKAREDASVQRSGEKEKETRAEREARRLGFDCPGPQSKWIQEAGSDFSPQPRARKRRDVDPPPSSPTPVQSDTNAKQSDTNAKTKKPRSISASAHVANAPPGLGTEASGGGGIGGGGGGGGNGGAVPPLSHRAKCKGGGPANCSAGAEGARGRDARVGLGEEEAGQSGMRNRDERLGAGGGSGGSASGRETLVCAILALVPVCGMRGACVRHAGVRVCVRACVRA